MTYRKTEAQIYLKNITNNVKKIIQNHGNYKYYIGVVKADCYGHNSHKVIQSIIDGGCNYLAVSSLDEAIIIRKKFNDIPILCLGITDPKHFKIYQKYNIDITVTSLEQINFLKKYNLNIHLKIDTGMNRLGIKSKKEFDLILNNIKDNNLHIQGIYTHIYEAANKFKTLNQINRFKQITSSIDLNSIPIVHIAQSETLINYEKINFCNGCRMGIIMYGLINNNINLENTLSLTSEVIEIKHLKQGETVSYNGIYKALKDEIIGVVSIGYADGINRKLTGAYVYINENKYQIIGNICMDMLMIKIDSKVKLHDKVYLYKNIEHIKELSNHLNTIPYELICSISKRVPRKYLN